MIDKEEHPTVSLLAFESSLARMERVNKRLIFVTVLALIMSIMSMAFMIFK